MKEIWSAYNANTRDSYAATIRLYEVDDDNPAIKIKVVDTIQGIGPDTALSMAAALIKHAAKKKGLNPTNVEIKFHD